MHGLLLIPAAFAAERFEGYTVYFGDIHAHTGASGDGGSSDLGDCARWDDGSPASCGSVEGIADTARANGLDFFVVLDHVNGDKARAPSVFEDVFQRVNALDAPDDGLVTIPGAEIFVELPDGSYLGHRSLLLFGDVDTLAGVTMTDLQPAGSVANEVPDCAALSTFMEGLTARFGPALLFPHHPGGTLPMATDWSCHDPAWAPVVEAYSNHGSSLDPDSPFDPPWSGYQPSGTVLFAIDPSKNGHTLGFAAGSDNHDTHPGQVCTPDSVMVLHPYAAGLTGVVLEDGAPFDRAAIHDAFVARHTYATTGPMLPLLVEAITPDGATSAGMGDALEVPTDGTITLTARVPADLAWAVTGAAAHTPEGVLPMTPTEAGVWTIALGAAEMGRYVFVDVEVDAGLWWPDGCDDGGDTTEDHLWSSPIWVTYSAAERPERPEHTRPSEPACGCGTEGPGTGAGLLGTVALLGARRRARRRPIAARLGSAGHPC